MTDDGTGRLDIGDGEEAVIVFVLGIYYHQDTILRGGFGGFDAEEAERI